MMIVQYFSILNGETEIKINRKSADPRKSCTTVHRICKFVLEHFKDTKALTRRIKEWRQTPSMPSCNQVSLYMKAYSMYNEQD